MNSEVMFQCCNILKFLKEKIEDIKNMAKEDMTQENLDGFEYATKNISSLFESLVKCAEMDGEILVHSSDLKPEYEIYEIVEFDLHDLLAHFNCRVIAEKSIE